MMHDLSLSRIIWAKPAGAIFLSFLYPQDVKNLSSVNKNLYNALYLSENAKSYWDSEIAKSYWINNFRQQFIWTLTKDKEPNYRNLSASAIHKLFKDTYNSEYASNEFYQKHIFTLIKNQNFHKFISYIEELKKIYGTAYLGNRLHAFTDCYGYSAYEWCLMLGLTDFAEYLYKNFPKKNLKTIFLPSRLAGDDLEKSNNYTAFEKTLTSLLFKTIYYRHNFLLNSLLIHYQQNIDCVLKKWYLDGIGPFTYITAPPYAHAAIKGNLNNVLAFSDYSPMWQVIWTKDFSYIQQMIYFLCSKINQFKESVTVLSKEPSIRLNILHLAAAKMELYDFVTLMKLSGLNPNIEGSYSLLPAHIAILYGNLPVLKKLFADDKGKTLNALVSFADQHERNVHYINLLDFAVMAYLLRAKTIFLKYIQESRNEQKIKLNQESSNHKQFILQKNFHRLLGLIQVLDYLLTKFAESKYPDYLKVVTSLTNKPFGALYRHVLISALQEEMKKCLESNLTIATEIAMYDISFCIKNFIPQLLRPFYSPYVFMANSISAHHLDQAYTPFKVHPKKIVIWESIWIGMSLITSMGLLLAFLDKDFSLQIGSYRFVRTSLLLTLGIILAITLTGLATTTITACYLKRGQLAEIKNSFANCPRLAAKQIGKFGSQLFSFYPSKQHDIENQLVTEEQKHLLEVMPSEIDFAYEWQEMKEFTNVAQPDENMPLAKQKGVSS